MLAANVNLSVIAGAVTMTATDAGDPSVFVHRVDATNVAFDVSPGTQMTYNGSVHAASFNVAIPTVSSLTVNLGSGFDVFNIFDLSVAGAVVFNGKSTGSAGANLDVSSSAASVVIGGPIIANLGNQNGGLLSSFALTAGDAPLTVYGFVRITDGGTANHNNSLSSSGDANLTILGAVTMNDSGSGTHFDQLVTQGSGDFNVLGPVSISNSGDGTHFNQFFTTNGDLAMHGSISVYDSGAGTHFTQIFPGAGNVVVTGFVNIADAGDGDHFDQVFTSSTGNLSVGGPVTVGDSGTGDHFNQIFANASGNIVLGPLSVYDSGDGSHMDQFFSTGSGNLSVNGIGLNDSGNGLHTNQLFASSTGDITVNGSFSLTDSGTGTSFDNVFVSGNGSLLILGSLIVLDLGTGHTEFDLQVQDANGNVTINGGVLFNNSLNTSSRDTVFVDVEGSGSGELTVRGGLTLLLSNCASDADYLQLGGDGSITTKRATFGGPVFVATGSGGDTIIVTEAVFGNAVTINTGTSPSTTLDLLLIYGADFDGLVSISMYGVNALLDVSASQVGFEPTIFRGAVSVFMNGPGASILLSNTTDPGTPVEFDSFFTVIGGIGGFPAGTLHRDGLISFAFAPILINFALAP